MNRLAELRLQRERLVARSAVQRIELARALAPLSGPIAIVERGLAGVLWLRRHPAAIAIGVAFMMIIRPQRLLGGVRQGMTAWRIAQTVLPLIGPLIAGIATSRLNRTRKP